MRAADPPALSRSTVDRAAHRRADETWLRSAWADPGSRVLVVANGKALVRYDGGLPTLVAVSPAEAPAGDRALLGVDDGGVWWSVSGPLPDAPLDPRSDGGNARAAGLREVGALLDDRDAGLLTHAVALANWHAVAGHCPRCGARTESVLGGSARRCTQDGSEQHPRSDPASIMLVHDGAECCLLGRQVGWPTGLFSTLAGFVEPGESAEQAVVREVAEEVGLAVGDVVYADSQPWPFPASLMLGFTCRALDPAAQLQLQADEIADARWLTRADLAGGVVSLPPPVSIAHRLITTWAASG